jgi:hypothetical protein
MGKSKNIVEEELAPTREDKMKAKEAKKTQKKEVKQALKALHLSHEAPAYVDPKDCDALLLGLGLPVSKLKALDVSFEGRVVHAGDLFSRTKAAHRFLHDEPVVTFDSSDPHTILMFDVDAPERDAESDGALPGKRGPWLHHMVTDVVSTATSGKCVTDWLAPAPALGVHRFIWLAFKGAMHDPKKSDERICYNLQHFMEKNANLQPVAFNFIYVTSF